MATVHDLLANKGSQVYTVGPDATVLEAALVMNEHRVGAVVVLDAGRLAGMFTERDVLCRVVGERRDPVTTRVADVMTSAVVCSRPETTVEEARQILMHRRIRHLPVLDGGGRLLGLVSIGDLNAHQAMSQEQTIYQMHEYIHGRA